jgi:hypothetical protein
MQVTRTGWTPADPDGPDGAGRDGSDGVRGAQGAHGVLGADAAPASVPAQRPAPVAPEAVAAQAAVPAATSTRRARRERARAQTPHRPRRRTRRVVLGLVAAGLVAVVAWVGWLALDAVRARAELQSAAADVAALRAQVLGGDRSAAETTLASLQDHAATAHDRTHGPHWTLAGALPRVGASVRAVQTISDVVDDLAVEALPALMDATALVDPASLAPVDGRVDLSPLVAAAPQVVAADAAVQRSLAAVRAIDAGAVVPVVATQVTALDGQLADVAMTTATAARAVQLLPPMLGADGPRQYLLLVQNNAELRATGGIPGSVVLLRADDGAVDVVEQRSGGSLGDLAAPVLPLSTAEQALFGEDLAADMRDVTFTPDFPRSGEIARAIWQQEVGDRVDGVLSIDPGALAHVLGATGPVSLPGGQQLTAENAVRMLLNTVYLEIEDPQAQDAFFAATAGTVFDAVVSGRGDSAAAVDALAQGAREGRLMMWSAHEDEQALLAGTVLSGELRGVQGESPVVGVYFNDVIAAKMGFYLRSDVAVATTDCRADGSQALTVAVSLTSTAPADRADLPRYVSGTARADVPAGDIRTNVLLYAPTGGYIEDARLDGAQLAGLSQSHGGSAVLGGTVQLAPGRQAILEYDVVTGPGQWDVPVIRTTPTASGEVREAGSTECSTPPGLAR